MAVKAPPELTRGTLWRRDAPGSEVVQVVAVASVAGRIAVTVLPKRGGRPRRYDAAWFCEHYTPEEVA